MAVAPRRWERLSLPKLLLASAVISLLSTNHPAAVAFSTSRWRRSRIRVTLRSSSSTDDNDGPLFPYHHLAPLQRRLDLTPEQATLIQNRIDGITPRTNHQQQQEQNCNNDVEQTMERNVAYLEEHLGMTIEQLQRVVVGYPLVLSMRFIKFVSTVEFFGDALCSDGIFDNDHGKRRLSAFLCELPSLLEYNVDKRLNPRLERLRRTTKAEGGSVVADVDEEMLHSIATLTDSRFETWLSQINDIQKSGNETATNVSTTRRHPNNNHPSAYVILSNLQSGGNIGNIVRSASIFGCEECIVVGQKRYRMTGDHGSRLDLPQRHMWSHADVKDYLNSKRVRIYGIEIMENASPIMQYDRETGVVKFPFESECEGGWSGSAFVFGNEGQGLSTKQREICDEFLFIPQNRGGGIGGGGSASMNVACAAAVVLQAYCMWAGYSEARCEGEKFLA
jgi:tRNA G18 (ribose-2'-O)-methylase SpoU